MKVNTNRFSEQQFVYKTNHHSGLFYLRIHRPARHLKLIQGGQTAKQYAPKIETNQSNTTRLPAA